MADRRWKTVFNKLWPYMLNTRKYLDQCNLLPLGLTKLPEVYPFSIIQYWPPNTILVPRLLVLFSLGVLHTPWMHACMQKFGDVKFSEVKFFKNRVKFGTICIIFRTIKEWIIQPKNSFLQSHPLCRMCLGQYQASSAALWWTVSCEDGNPWFLGPWVPITMKIWGLRHKIYIDIETPIPISMIHRYCDPSMIYRYGDPFIDLFLLGSG